MLTRRNLFLCSVLMIMKTPMVLGQQTFAPITPSLPTPPTFNNVVNGSVVAFVGQTIRVEEDIKVIIDCSQMVDAILNHRILNPTITWYKNGIPIVNGSAVNTIISSDNRLCIINNTLLSVGNQVGSESNLETSGNYTCEVCNGTTCMNMTSPKVVCDLLSSSDESELLLPNIIILICGQDVIISNLMEIIAVALICPVHNESDLLTFEAFKDGVFINDSFSSSDNGFSLTFQPPNDDVFGTYTFIVSTERCGNAFAVSRILRSGSPPDIDEGPFVQQPPRIVNGTKRVDIGTPVYVVDGNTVVIDCNILGGTPPITVSWLYNGVLDQNRGNVSKITIVARLKENNGSIFSCRAINNVGFDIENTTINIFDAETPASSSVNKMSGRSTSLWMIVGISAGVFISITL